MPRKPLYYEAGPNWEMVEQWIESYQDTTKRSLSITLGFHKFRNGYSGLYVSAQSFLRRGTQEHIFSHATCWYWPNKQYVSLPAMVIGLITAHEKETEARQARWDEMPPAMPLEELPLF